MLFALLFPAYNFWTQAAGNIPPCLFNSSDSRLVVAQTRPSVFRFCTAADAALDPATFTRAEIQSRVPMDLGGSGNGQAAPVVAGCAGLSWDCAPTARRGQAFDLVHSHAYYFARIRGAGAWAVSRAASSAAFCRFNDTDSDGPCNLLPDLPPDLFLPSAQALPRTFPAAFPMVGQDGHPSRGGALALALFDPWDLALPGKFMFNGSCARGCPDVGGPRGPAGEALLCAGCDFPGEVVARAEAAAVDKGSRSLPTMLFWLDPPAHVISPSAAAENSLFILAVVMVLSGIAFVLLLGVICCEWSLDPRRPPPPALWRNRSSGLLSGALGYTDAAAAAAAAEAVQGSGPWYAGQRLHVMGDCTLSMNHVAATEGSKFSWDLAVLNSVWGNVDASDVH